MLHQEKLSRLGVYDCARRRRSSMQHPPSAMGVSRRQGLYRPSPPLQRGEQFKDGSLLCTWRSRAGMEDMLGQDECCWRSSSSSAEHLSPKRSPKRARPTTAALVCLTSRSKRGPGEPDNLEVRRRGSLRIIARLAVRSRIARGSKYRAKESRRHAEENGEDRCSERGVRLGILLQEGPAPDMQESRRFARCRGAVPLPTLTAGLPAGTNLRHDVKQTLDRALNKVCPLHRNLIPVNADFDNRRGSHVNNRRLLGQELANFYRTQLVEVSGEQNRFICGRQLGCEAQRASRELRTGDGFLAWNQQSKSTRRDGLVHLGIWQGRFRCEQEDGLGMRSYTPSAAICSKSPTAEVNTPVGTVMASSAGRNACCLREDCTAKGGGWRCFRLEVTGRPSADFALMATSSSDGSTN